MDQSTLLKDVSKTVKDVRSLFEQFRDTSLDDRKRSMLQWLSPVDPSVSQEAALKIHQSGTSDWFLSCKEFKHWQEAEKSVLWLSGFPGSGKTIMMSTVVDYLQHHNKSSVVAYFYCSFRSPETRDPLNLAGSILAQVCFQLSSYPAALDDAFSRSKMSATPNSGRISLEMVIESLLELSSVRSIVILVDGLDEYDLPEQRREILEFFRKLSDEGIKLKILIGSRDDVDIRESLNDFPRISLESALDRIGRDIEHYIDYRLEHDSAFKWLKHSFKLIIRDRLSTHANGM